MNCIYGTAISSELIFIAVQNQVNLSVYGSTKSSELVLASGGTVTLILFKFLCINQFTGT